MEIYFDNSATTRVCPEAMQAARQAMELSYGNASSLHRKGVEAARLLADARRLFAALLQVKEQELFFTSCATESNNTAICGIAAANRRRGLRVLVSAVEHPSVLEPALALQEQGFQVEQIPVDKSGRVDLAAFAALLQADTVLVSVQHVNNETGAVQPLTEIGALVRRQAPNAAFHVDGVQGFTKLPVELARWQADAYSLSGHKIAAPKGVGLLWLKKGIRCLPLLRGGGQEGHFRSGTENIPFISAFAAAAQKYARPSTQMGAVRQALAQALQERVPNCHFNSDLSMGAPHILNVSFPGAKSEVLLHTLEQAGLFVSSGSACHSNKKDAQSPVLRAMGLPRELADCAIRYSFCPENTVEEALAAADITARAVDMLRKL